MEKKAEKQKSIAKKINPESEGVGLVCTLGTSKSKLKVVADQGVSVKGKKPATIKDCKGNINITSFTLCNREIPPVPCDPTICIHWLYGNEEIKIKDELALLNI